MKQILQQQTKWPIRAFETNYGFLVKSRCGWPHASKAKLYTIILLVFLLLVSVYVGLKIPEGSSFEALRQWIVIGGMLIIVSFIFAFFEQFIPSKDDEQKPKKEKKKKTPEERARNIALSFKINTNKMSVTARFGVEQKFSAPIEPTSFFSLDGDRFRYITGDINTSKFEAQIAPRKRLTIVGFRRDTIGEMIDLARILNHLLNEVRGSNPDDGDLIEVPRDGGTSEKRGERPQEPFNPLD